jgi:uncharacterized protein
VPAAPTRHFDDRAGWVSKDAAATLDAQLLEFERQTGHQIFVSIFKKLPSASLEDFTVRTAQAWRIGRKGMDDGAILFAFVDDRKLRIEVGYGLEGQIPDAVAKRILSEHVGPLLSEGKVDEAFDAGVNALTSAASGQPLPGEPAAGTEAEPAPVATPDNAPELGEQIPVSPDSLQGIDKFFYLFGQVAHFQVAGIPVGLLGLIFGLPMATSPILRFLPIRRRFKRGDPLLQAWAIESLILLWLVVSNLRSGSSSGGSSYGGSSSSSSGGGGRFGGGGASGSW